MLMLTLHHAGPTSMENGCPKTNQHGPVSIKRTASTHWPFITEVNLWNNNCLLVTRGRQRSPSLWLISPVKRAASQAANRIEFGSRINNRQHSPYKSHTVWKNYQLSAKHLTFSSGKGHTSVGVQYSPEIGTSIFRLSGKEVHRERGGAQMTQQGRPLDVRCGTTWTSTHLGTDGAELLTVFIMFIPLISTVGNKEEL